MTPHRLLATAAFIAQRTLGRRPLPYFAIRRVLTRKPELAADQHTEIVIEGFPRSANSFSVVAFEQAQQCHVRIAHHLHVPAQIIRGVRRGIPVIVLLREPVAAISSLVVRESALDIGVALWDYVNFHRKIFGYRNEFVVARFEDVTTNFGSVIDRVNKKWGAQFGIFQHNEQNVARAFARLDQLEVQEDNGRVDEDRVARPSAERTARATELRRQLESPRFAKRLAVARKLYTDLDAQG